MIRTPRIPGRWTALPRDTGGEVKHVAVAASSAGVFLGVTSEHGPRIFHGRIAGSHIEWSPPWTVPVPPPQPHVEHVASWEEYEGALLGVDIAIDRLDAMRIAVNRLEYQGGSFGIAVGRWHEAIVEVASPTDADMRFGLPMVLRGSELFTHEHTDFWRFRLNGSSTAGDALPLHETVEELGWHAGVDASGDVVVLEAFSELVILQRDGAGKFQMHRKLNVPSSISGLGVSAHGDATVVLGREDGFDVVVYDREGREVRKQTIAAPITWGIHAPPYGVYGDYVLRDTAEGILVFNVASSRHVMLDASRTVPWPAPTQAEIVAAMHAQDIVLASRDGVGLYSVAGVL